MMSVDLASPDLHGALLILLTEGDVVRGLGHLSRCSGFADRWASWGGRTLWVVDGDDAARGAMAGREALWSRWQTALTDEVALEGAAVVVDSYSAELDLLAQVARRAGAVLYLDDTLRLPYPAGLAVNSTPGDLGALPGEAEWLTGPTWHPVRPAFTQVGPRGPVSRDVERVLVLSGGADLHGFSHLGRRAVRAAFPRAELHVVAGPGAKGYDETIDDPSLVVHRALDAAAMRDQMLGADLAVSAAGQTLYELALCGCPTASVGLADNQAHNLREWDRLGSAVAVGWHNDPNLEARLTDALLSLAPAERRQDLSQAGQAAIDGCGTERLLSVLAERLGFGR